MKERTGLVIVASTRAAQGIYEDQSGPIAVKLLRDLGYHTPAPKIISDHDIPRFISELFSQPEHLPDVLLTSGGTGVTPDDRTVDAILPYIDKPMPGVVQDFFQRGLKNTPLAIASRAIAGISGRTFVMTLPGSRGGVKDGCATLKPLLAHITDLLNRPVPPLPTLAPGVLLGAHIFDAPLADYLPHAREQVLTEEMGALVSFDGVVRNHDGGQAVSSLTYSAHPCAENVLNEVCRDVLTQHPEVRAWVAHRVGALKIGDSAFAVLVSSAHRKAAFAAAEALTDRVKAEVPIWKEQHMSDGTTQWVGLK